MLKKSLKVSLLISLIWMTNAEATVFDHGGGLIYDDVLNITILQDANYAKTSGFDLDGNLNWDAAIAWSKTVSYFDVNRNVTYSDWRLPILTPIDGIALKQDFAFDGTSEVGQNITSPTNELAFLFNVELKNSTNPFFNLPTVEKWVNGVGDWYWYQTKYPFGTSSYYFDTLNGSQNVSEWSNQHLVLLVRNGDVAPVPEPETYAMLMAGLGVMGFVARRRKNKVA
jgi:hypothetical protein